jgi:uncharacterized protein (TIRG00374 family)
VGTELRGGPAPPAAGARGRGRRARARARLGPSWPKVRLVLSLALLGVAAALLASRGHQLAGAGRRLRQLRWGWVGVAIGFEAASMVIFARLQRWLLRAGGVRLRLRTMVEITLAGNALGTSLPGGVAFSGAWVFGQLRRRGVSRAVSTWVLLVAGALSSFALFLVAAAGVELAGSSGPLRSMRLPMLVLTLIPVCAGAGVAAYHRSASFRRQVERASAWLAERSALGRRLEEALGTTLRRAEVVRLSLWGWCEVLGLALVNWLDDCACLVACILALGLAVPWRFVLVIYGFTQVSASLPITPGGIGVVEGSLAGLLTAYGTPFDASVATVVLYRIVSFWALVPVGWGMWVYLDLVERHRPRARAHPWAAHPGAGADGPPAARPPSLLPSPPDCPGCPDEAGEEVGAASVGGSAAQAEGR